MSDSLPPQASQSAVAAVVFWILQNLKDLVGWLWGHRTQRSVARKVETPIQRFARRIDAESGGALPYRMRVHWIEAGNDAWAAIERGNVVVRMKDTRDQRRNLMLATVLYVREGAVPEVKPYLDPTMVEAIDATLVAKILREENQVSAFRLFQEEQFRPKLAERAEFAEDCRTMEQLDQQGTFTRIFLSELRDMGWRLGGALPEPTLVDLTAKEARDLLDFLKVLAEREGEEAPLNFAGERVRFAVVLVGRRDVILSYGTQPYFNAVIQALSWRVDRIYALAMGKNVEVAKDLVRHLTGDQRFRQITQGNEFDCERGKRRDRALCVVIIPARARPLAGTRDLRQGTP